VEVIWVPTIVNTKVAKETLEHREKNFGNRKRKKRREKSGIFSRREISHPGGPKRIRMEIFLWILERGRGESKEAFLQRSSGKEKLSHRCGKGETQGCPESPALRKGSQTDITSYDAWGVVGGWNRFSLLGKAVDSTGKRHLQRQMTSYVGKKKSRRYKLRLVQLRQVKSVSSEDLPVPRRVVQSS